MTSPVSLVRDKNVKLMLPTDRPRSRRVLPLSRTARVIRALSWMNLAGLGALLVLLYGISERWWLGIVLTYLPRFQYVVPSLILLLGATLWHRRSVWLNLVGISVAFGPVMGWQFGAPALLIPSDPARELTVVSCNVQKFRPDFELVLNEIAVIGADIVALQEAHSNHRLLNEFFDDWHVAFAGEFWVASKFPVRYIERIQAPGFDRVSAARFEIDTPRGTIELVNVHQTSPRPALVNLSLASLWNGEGPAEIEAQQLQRRQEARATRKFAQPAGLTRPALVVGDFNMPASSHLFRKHWGDLQNAFQRSGWGYGYTANCDDETFGMRGLPWIRVDHILTTADWQMAASQVGRSNGSDHRLIAARLLLRDPRDSAR